MLVRKKHLNAAEKRAYHKLLSGKNFIANFGSTTETQKIELLKPVKAYLINWYFRTHYQFTRHTPPEKEVRHNFVKWYFDNGYISDELKRAIIKIGRQLCSVDYSLHKYEYMDDDFIKNNFRYLIETDPFGFLHHGLQTTNKKIIMHTLKEEPRLFPELHHFNIDQAVSYEVPTLGIYFIRKALRMAALQSARRGREIFILIPKSMFTSTFCEKLVSEVGGNLHLIPKDRITERVAMLAVTKAGTALRFVPAKIRTEAICAAALANSPAALKYMSGEEQSSRLVFKALLKNNNARRYLKKNSAAGTK